MKELNQAEMTAHFQRLIAEHIRADEKLHAIQRKERFWNGVFYSGCTAMVLIPVLAWAFF